MDSAKVWSNLEQDANIEEFVNAWLTIQCSMIQGCIQAVLVLKDADRGGFVPVASWPEGSGGEQLTGILDRTLSEAEGMLVQLSPSEKSSPSDFQQYGLAFPVTVDDTLIGAVAVEMTAASEESLRPAMEGLQWGVVWLENMYRRRQGEEDRKTLKRMKAAVDILAAVLGEDHFEGAAMAFVTEVATKLECDRVSLGLVKGNHTSVKAISHTAVVGKKMNLVQSIGAAMDEALMQRTEILYPVPPETGSLVTRDHELMEQRHGTRAMITLPLYGRDRYYAAITLERQDDRPFTADDMVYVKSVVALSGPVLDNKYHSDRPIIFGVFESLKRQVVRLVGPGYLARKAAVIIVLVMAVFFGIVRDEYKLSANAVLEGSISRSLVAPMDGYIKEASVRAGDVVKKDALICRLDDRMLQLEKLNLLSKRGQYQRQHQKALAEHNRAEANIISAQLDQATAELNLVENKLAQIVIRAPFEGVVLSGDLSQRHGGAVRQGEELFQIAPLDAYRLILKVDEYKVADVAEGQRGILILSSLPDEKFEFTVRKITPITTAEEGRNYFRIEANLDKASPRFRPGMEGVGKVKVDRRLVFSIWTRSLIDWLRIRLWSWWP